MFKRVFQHVLSAGLLFTAVSLSAAPIQYEFKYTFADADQNIVVRGSFWGDQFDGYIANIQNASLEFNGQLYFEAETGGFGDNGVSVAGAGIVTEDLSTTSVYFQEPGYSLWGFWLNIGTLDSPGSGADVFDHSWGFYYHDVAGEAGEWIVRPVSASVPEAGTTVLLLLTALSGAALLQRRFSASA